MIRTALVALCVTACSKPAREARPVAAPCALAMVVDATGVSIGTLAGTCRAPRIGGKPDVAWVEAELRGLRAAFGSCAVAAELVAETGAYQELITLMDVAVKTGFVDVSVADRSDVRFAMTGASDAHCKLPSPPPETPVARPVAQLTPEQARVLEQDEPLPAPPTKPELQAAPVIVVTTTELTFRGQVVAPVDAIVKDPDALKPLAELLAADDASTKRKLAAGGLPPELAKACDDARHGIRPSPGSICPLGLAILQADAATDMRVINAVLHTAHRAGFDNVLFAVKSS